MAVIGTFKPGKDGGWEGIIRTLTVNEKIRLLPNDDRVSDTAPAFRVMLGWQRIGDAWEAQTEEKTPRDYLRVRIDDPSFPAPISAALFPGHEGMSALLLWNRSRERTHGY